MISKKQPGPPLVFMSYAKEDKERVLQIYDLLKKVGLRPWMDIRDLLPGTFWPGEIEKTVHRADFFLAFFSDTSVKKSGYVQKEYRLALNALAEKPQGSIYLIPVKLDSCEIPDIAIPVWGIHMRDLQWLDLSLSHPDHLEFPSLKLSDIEPILKAIEAQSGWQPPSEDEGFLKYFDRMRELCRDEFSTKLFTPDRVYVPQYASTRSDSPEQVNLLDVAKEFWQGKTPRVAVLGNYGMGKSYFAWRITLDQINRYPSSKHQKAPILYPLGDFRYEEMQAARKKDIVDQMLEYVVSHDFPQLDKKRFVRLIEDGTVGIILDGLDELKIPRGESWQDVLKPLLEINGAHLVITSRTAHVQDPDRSLAGYAVFDLLDWSEMQWKDYLEYSNEHLAEVGGKDRFFDAVAKKPKLSQLTIRPLWCYMIVFTCKKVAKVEDMDTSGLYQEFLDEAVRGKMLPTIILTLTDRYYAMERFAEECIRENHPSMKEEQLVGLLSNIFEEYGDSKLNSYLTKEARSYTFLNCDRYRYYSIGHSSFQDYFAAAGIARWLIEQATGYRSGPTEYVAHSPLLADHHLSEDQVIFAVGILQDEKILKTLRIISDDANYAEAYANSILFLQKELSDGEKPPLGRANMFRIYLRMLQEKNGRRPYLNGLALQNTNLAGLDLSGCDLRDINFTEAILSNALFVKSTLVGCNFFAATIDGADFTEADLTEAYLIGIELPQVSPVFTNSRNKDRAKISERERRLVFE